MKWETEDSNVRVMFDLKITRKRDVHSDPQVDPHLKETVAAPVFRHVLMPVASAWFRHPWIVPTEHRLWICAIAELRASVLGIFAGTIPDRRSAVIDAEELQRKTLA